MSKILTKLLTVIFLIIGLPKIQSQNISEFFLKMPTSLAPTLSEQQRFEMLEYYKSNKSDSTRNRYGNYVKVLYLDTINQQLRAKTTENNLIEIKLFKTHEGEVVVGIINTVLSPVEVSNIQFFDSNWQISKIEFTIPNASIWLTNNALDSINMNENWLKSIVEQKFVKLDFSKTDSQIIVRNQVLNFVTQENKKELSDLMDNQPLVYELNENKWKLKETANSKQQKEE